MNRRRTRGPLWALTLLPPVLVLLFLFVGRYGGSLSESLRALFGLQGASDVLGALLLRVRLPRLLAAACVGASLAGSGAVLQGLFRNPLVEGRILGVSSGAAFGAAVALLLSGGAAAVQGLSFAFALGAIALVILIGWRFGSSTLVVVVGGIAVSALFDSLLALVKYVADPLSKLPAITYWLLGSLSQASWGTLLPLLVVTTGGLAFLFLLRWRLDVLTLGEAEAATLGVRVRPLRVVVIVTSALLIAASVSVAGTIGWIGLLVPHAARAAVGPSHARLLPASAALGASAVIVLDTVSRTALTSEIPLGVLTGLLGVPAFLALFLHVLRRSEEVR